jgi:predicted Zn-dependent protease
MRHAAIAMRHTVIIVGSLCFALLAGSARAATPDVMPNDDTVQSAPAETAACLPWRAAVLSAKAADSHNALVNVMEGAEASDFLSFANALPPTSHVDGNRVAIVFAPENDQFIFVVGQQNCATAIMQVPRAAIEQLTGSSV